MAIVALIPDPLGRGLARLGSLVDPENWKRLAPHIPLVGPFQARAPFLPLEQHCQRVCHRTAPFSVDLDLPVVDEGERLVSAEIISAEEDLVGLREALLVGRYAPPHDGTEYRPRALIARVADEADMAVARREATAIDLELSFQVERVELMAQYPDGSWYERDFYTLDGVVTAA